MLTFQLGADFACVTALCTFTFCAPALAQNQDQQKMLESIMQNAPPELRRNMDAEMQRQKEGRPEPRVSPSPPPAHSSAVTMENFLDGVWVGVPFKKSCDPNSPDQPRYRWDEWEKWTFTINGNILHITDNLLTYNGWVAKHYSYKILHPEPATQDDITKYTTYASLRPIGYLSLQAITPGLKDHNLYFSEASYSSSISSFSGRVVSTGAYSNQGYFSCSGTFSHYDTPPAPTQGLTR